MQIHELTIPKRKKVQRIGRGGKRGTTAGRGTKGQGAHGKKKDPLFEGGRSTLIERMKKVRGFKSPHPKKVTVTLYHLEKAYADGETVSIDTLLAKRVVSSRAKTAGVKIVASGKLSKKLSLGNDVSCSEAARALFK